MSLPSSFTIFSPSFSVFKSITPQEYLQRSEKLMETLPQWKEVAIVVGALSFISLLVSAAVMVVAEDEAKSEKEQGKAYNIALGFGVISIMAVFSACVAYPTIHYGIEPMLAKRIEWLQAAFSS